MCEQIFEWQGARYFVTDILAKAQQEHFRITPCESCGGPRVHSKVRPESKCLRCRDFQRHEQISPVEKKTRCDRCRKFFWAVNQTAFCGPCQESRKASEQRRKRTGINVGQKPFCDVRVDLTS